jgi:hypothetical protein
MRTSEWYLLPYNHYDDIITMITNCIKKAEPFLTLPSPSAVRTAVLITRMCEPGLFLNLSSHSRKSQQANAEKDHGGGFGG